MKHLLGFADHLGAKRNLPPEAVDAVKEVIEAIKAPQLISQSRGCWFLSTRWFTYRDYIDREKPDASQESL